jgi:predicted metal-dependent hydrolase
VRYVAGRPFPPYAFLPGRDPHPTRDPAGHSFGRSEPEPPRLPPALWRANEPYLFGVDLYNHGYLWEAHEAWEGLWHASKPDRCQALFLQGLIQCAAAWLKIAMDQPRGVERLAALALEKLDAVREEEGPRYMGADLDAFAAAARDFAASRPTELAGYPRLALEAE